MTLLDVGRRKLSNFAIDRFFGQRQSQLFDQRIQQPRRLDLTFGARRQILTHRLGNGRVVESHVFAGPQPGFREQTLRVLAHQAGRHLEWMAAEHLPHQVALHLLLGPALRRALQILAQLCAQLFQRVAFAVVFRELVVQARHFLSRDVVNGHLKIRAQDVRRRIGISLRRLGQRERETQPVALLRAQDLFLKPGQQRFLAHLEQTSGPFQTGEQPPFPLGAIIESDHVAGLDVVTVRNGVQLGQRVGQPRQGVVDRLLGHGRDGFLDRQALVCDVRHIGLGLHGRRVTERAATRQPFGHDLGLADHRKPVFPNRLGEGFFDQGRADFGRNLFAEAALDDAARYSAGAESLQLHLALIPLIGAFQTGLHPVGGNLDGNLRLDRTRGFDRNLHTLPCRVMGRGRRAGVPLDERCVREGGLEPPPAPSGLDPKSSASPNFATLAYRKRQDGPPEARTPDPLIKSQLLCQLS